MVGYLLKRLLQSVAFIGLSLLLIYSVLVYLMPGGPKAQYERIRATYTDVGSMPDFEDDRLTRATKQYKLDKPWPLSFLTWLFDPSDTTQLGGYYNDEVLPKGININIFGLEIKGSGMLTGDFGKSEPRGGFAQGVLVSQLIADRWVQTVSLIIYALLITVAIALPLGIIGAIKHRATADHAITF